MRPPTSNPVTQTKHGDYTAVDYSSRPDPNIYAPEDGKVTFYGVAGNCGNNLQIQSGNRRHGFCHLQEALVSAGQLVRKGQIVGVMGYTGLTIPSGPNGRHLHWVINIGGSTYVYPPSLVTEPFNQGEPMITKEQEQVLAQIATGSNPGAGYNYRFTGTSKWNECLNFWLAQSQLPAIRVALANEQNKPPTQVIKEVEKIVEVTAPVDERKVVESFLSRLWKSLFNR